MLNKIIIAIALSAATVTAFASSNTYYFEKAQKVLAANGYTKITRINQMSGFCTIAHAKNDFDWNAAEFTAVKKGVKLNGVVCLNKIYLG